MKDLPKICSENQACKIVGVSRPTLRKYRKAGRIRAVRISTRFWAYQVADLLAFKGQMGQVI